MSTPEIILLALLGFLIFLVVLAIVGWVTWLLYLLNKNVKQLAENMGKLPDSGQLFSILRQIPDHTLFQKLLAVSVEHGKALSEFNANITRFLEFAFTQSSLPSTATTGTDSSWVPYSDEVATANEIMSEAKLKKLNVDAEEVLRVVQKS